MAKGQLRVLEALIAIILMIGVSAWMFSFPPSLPQEIPDLKLKLLQALRSLDEAGELRKLAFTNNVSALEQEIFPYVPRTFDFEVLICELSQACEYSVEGAKDVYGVSYFLSSYLQNFSPREVRVYAWQL